MLGALKNRCMRSRAMAKEDAILGTRETTKAGRCSEIEPQINGDLKKSNGKNERAPTMLGGPVIVGLAVVAPHGLGC